MNEMYVDRPAVAQRDGSAEGLEAVALLLSSPREHVSVFQAIAEAAATLPGAKLARVWVDDAEAEVLREKGRSGIDDAVIRDLCDRTEFRYSEGLVGKAFVAGLAQFVADVQEEPSFRNPRLARAAGLHGFAGIPLTIGDRVLGVLSITFGEPQRFRPAQRETIILLGRQAAIALHTAHLLEQNEHRRHGAEGLAKLARSVSQSLETEEIARRAIDAVRESVGAESAALLRVTPGSSDLGVIAAWGEIASVFDGHAVFPRGAGLPAAAVHGGRPAMIADVLTDPRIELTPELRARIQGTTLRVALSVPLVANGSVIGVLGLWQRSQRLYSLDEIARAQAVADQVALALENARLYEDAQRAYTELRETQHHLVHTQKMEAIGRLAGGVAHDFNNLLTVILGRAEIAQRRPECDAATRHDLALIEATALRAARLTKQLLAFSRKQPLQPKIMDLNQLLSDMEPMLRRLIGEDVTLTTVLTPDLGLIEADPGQIEQVILNLIVNARDAMPLGGSVQVETDNTILHASDVPEPEGLRPGAYVVVRVTDTGHGMDVETQSHIFEPFFTTKDPGRGTGLGLSTVYGIIAQSGGHITVASTPQQGTTFTAYLPASGRQASVDPLDTRTTSNGTETILLVEDEIEVRRLLADVLQERGYHVIEAGDGRQGASLADAYPEQIDLLITDVVMPALSGPGLAALFEHRRPHTPVILMSGYTHDTITTYGASSMDGRLLHKPFSPDDLLHKVREAIDGSSVSQESAPVASYTLSANRRRGAGRDHDNPSRRHGLQDRTAAKG